MAKCKLCSHEVKGFKCDVCGEETEEFKADHKCGEEHLMPKCTGCNESEVQCTCAD